MSLLFAPLLFAPLLVAAAAGSALAIVAFIIRSRFGVALSGCIVGTSWARSADLFGLDAFPTGWRGASSGCFSCAIGVAPAWAATKLRLVAGTDFSEVATDGVTGVSAGLPLLPGATVAMAGARLVAPLVGKDFSVFGEGAEPFVSGGAANVP